MEPTASMSGGAGTLPVNAAQPRAHLGKMIAISLFWFAVTFHWTALQALIIPAQIYGLLLHAAPAGTLAARVAWVDAHKGLTEGIVLAPGLIVALLANPFFGLLSDRTPGRLGRRRPYILIGSFFNIGGLALMALGPLLATSDGSGLALAPSLLILMGGLMLTQLCNNAAAAPFHALLPDMIPEEQRGMASGIMGLALFLGQIGGAEVPTIFGFNIKALADGTQALSVFDNRIALAYGSVAVVMVVFAILTALTVHEQPWTPESATSGHGSAASGRALLLTMVAVVVIAAGTIGLTQARIGLSLDDTTLSIAQLLALVAAGIGAAIAFDFRPRRDPDFSWVVITRMLVMMGVYLVYTFLQYYMVDVVKSKNPSQDTSNFLVILTITALIATLAAGPVSDRFGRKRMVYISGAFMTLVGAAFILAPYFVPGQIVLITLISAAIFGLGYGAYVSVDWALVADVLPSETTYARDMGVWNIGLTIPQVLAAVFGGALLTLGVSIGQKQLGYTFLFISFVVFCILGTVTVRYIKGVKR
ncbi:MAG TPA: MFS transporter [Ktedonobacterales bacterium]